MSWLDNRKLDVESAIVGYIIGSEARKQDMEEIDWETTLDFVAEQGIEVNRTREFILSKTVDLGFIARDQLS